MLLWWALENQLPAPETTAAEQLSSSQAAGAKSLRFNQPFKITSMRMLLVTMGNPCSGFSFCHADPLLYPSLLPSFLPTVISSHWPGHTANASCLNPWPWRTSNQIRIILYSKFLSPVQEAWVKPFQLPLHHDQPEAGMGRSFSVFEKVNFWLHPFL